MKKLVFSALACVAFAGSSFASNEVIEESFTSNYADISCHMQVNIIEDGVLTEVLYFNGPLNLSRTACFSWATMIMDRLTEQGLEIDSFELIRA